MVIRCRARAYYALVEMQKKERRSIAEIVSALILEAAAQSGVDVTKLKEL